MKDILTLTQKQIINELYNEKGAECVLSFLDSLSKINRRIKTILNAVRKDSKFYKDKEARQFVVLKKLDDILNLTIYDQRIILDTKIGQLNIAYNDERIHLLDESDRIISYVEQEELNIDDLICKLLEVETFSDFVNLLTDYFVQNVCWGQTIDECVEIANDVIYDEDFYITKEDVKEYIYMIGDTYFLVNYTDY